MQQHHIIPAGSISGVPFVHAMVVLPLCAQSSSRNGGEDMQQQPCSLAREPRELLPSIHVQGRHEQWCSPVSPVLERPSTTGELSQNHNFLPIYLPFYLSIDRSFCCLLCRSCSVDLHLSLRRDYSKYRCIFEVFLGGDKLSILLYHHLGLSLWTYF